MAKTTKSGKSSRKAVTGGMLAVIIAIVLIIACFFTYISGILPRTLTGVSITETLPDGSTATVKNFSLLETNLHFKETFNSYVNYGMVSEDRLDEVYNEETGETYRDWLLKQAAGVSRIFPRPARSQHSIPRLWNCMPSSTVIRHLPSIFMRYTERE